MQNIKTVEYKTIESITNSWEYYQVIASVTDSVIYHLNEAIDCGDVNDKADLEELLNDTLLHEEIDQCSWSIYTSHHLPIIQYSDNDEYMMDNFGDECLAKSLKSGGLSGLHCALAFWALYADVYESITEVLSEYEPEDDTED